MAHEIDTTGNVIHMATSTANRAPWWQEEGFEAIRVNPDDTPEQWREAALNWEVKKAKVKFTGIYGKSKSAFEISLDDRFVIYRDDTLDYLTTDASDQYHVHTIGKLCEAMQLVCHSGGYRMNTIGSIRNGKEVWFMASTENDRNIAGEKFKRNVLIGTSYDQTKRSFSLCSDVATVCSNTLNYSINTADDIFRVSHREKYNPEKVVGDLKQIEQAQNDTLEQIETLANTKVSATEIADFFRAVSETMPTPKKYAKEPEAFRQEVINALVDSYTDAPGGWLSDTRVESRVGTLHGATQAVIHYVDFKMLTTLTGKSKTNRFNRAFFGDGAKLKRNAFDLALQQVA
jgi:phage/plasmid-like protein (TIGR03299 family)